MINMEKAISDLNILCELIESTRPGVRKELEQIVDSLSNLAGPVYMLGHPAHMGDEESVKALQCLHPVTTNERDVAAEDHWAAVVRLVAPEMNRLLRSMVANICRGLDADDVLPFDEPLEPIIRARLRAADH